MISKDNGFRARCQRLSIAALIILIALIGCRLSGPDVLPTAAPTPTEFARGPTFAPIVTVTPLPQNTAPATFPRQANASAADKTALGPRYEINPTVDAD